VFVVIVLLGALGYTPALRNQIKALESDGPDSPVYQAAGVRQRLFGTLFVIPILLILYLMVFKPFS
jgi:hypothetical protein